MFLLDLVTWHGKSKQQNDICYHILGYISTDQYFGSTSKSENKDILHYPSEDFWLLLGQGLTVRNEWIPCILVLASIERYNNALS